MARGHGPGSGGGGRYSIEDIDYKKIFDKNLYTNLLQYVKPYKFYLFVILFFVIITVSCDLSLPLISRHIIDYYINPKLKVISFSDEKQALNFYQKYKKILIELDSKNYLIKTKDEKKFLKNDYKILVNNNFLKNNLVYYLSYNKLSKEKILNIENLPTDKLIFFNTGIVINNKDLQSFDKNILKKLRYNDINKVKFFGILFFLLLIINFIFSYLQVYFITLMGQKIMFDIRVKLFNHLEKMNIKFFDNTPVGSLVTRVTNDINNLDEFFSAVLISLFKNIFILFGVLFVIFAIDKRLALISFFIIPLIIFTTFKFKSKMREAYRWTRKSIAKINAFLSENLTGMHIIQLFNREKLNYEKFTNQNHDYFLASINEMKLNALFRPLMSLLRYTAIAVILFSGSKFIIIGSLSVGTLVAFLAYIEKFFEPIEDISEKINIMQSALVSSERVFSLLEMQPEIEFYSEKPTLLPQKIKGIIEFKNVWFAYNNEDWILKNFSLKINSGEKIAIVGPTGAGKTTIINILNRFYEIQKGEILIDNVNIKNIPLNLLRKYIGVVQQNVFLFSGDIKSNIRLYNNEITDSDIVKVTQYTNAYNFITKLNNSFDTEVMEGGSTISTGQKQLISFSRVLAFNPQILVLDEATSNIDTETEILIQDALNKLMENRTSIIIAHRLSTIQHCDKIVVINKGEIAEIGTHQELLEQKGIYYKLYLLQYKDQLISDTNKDIFIKNEL